jgi:hypothetical protein
MSLLVGCRFIVPLKIDNKSYKDIEVEGK